LYDLAFEKTELIVHVKWSPSSLRLSQCNAASWLPLVRIYHPMAGRSAWGR